MVSVAHGLRQMAVHAQAFTDSLATVVHRIQVETSPGRWYAVPRAVSAASMRVELDAPPPLTDWDGSHVLVWGGYNDTAEPLNSSEFDIERGPGYWQRTYGGVVPPTTRRTWPMQDESPRRWDDQRRIPCPTNVTISWPDEGYPCQLCWAAERWPWEPLRVCPLSVSVESTYCAKHAGILGT